MTSRLLIALVGIVMLLSLAQVGVLYGSAIDSQQTSQLKEKGTDERNMILSSAITGDEIAGGNNLSPTYRTGAIPTQIIPLELNTTDLGSVQVGDPITSHSKLIRTDTAAGIPGAIIRTASSFNNKTWIDFGGYFFSPCSPTGSKGEFGQTGNVPDPYPYSPFPATYYIKYTYEGNSTYAASSITYSVTVLRPTGTIPTQFTPLMMNTLSTVHVGDQIKARARLIRTDTGAGIPRANVRAAGSINNKTWTYTDIGVCVTTDSKGEGNLTFIVPDPRLLLFQLPLTVYIKVVYGGNSTYAPTSYFISSKVLPP